MVGGYGISKQRQNACILDILDVSQTVCQMLKEWRILNIRGIIIPLIQLALWNRDRIPTFISSEYILVFTTEHLRTKGETDSFTNFSSSWPNILQEYWLTLWIKSKRFSLQIDIYSASQCVSNYERR
ncbi:hypothetical protein D3C71_1246720 [compost metagenome]